MKKNLLFLATLAAGSALAGDISVKDCIIQEVIDGNNATAAFFTLENAGQNTVALTAVAAPKITNNVQIHKMIMDKQKAMMEMQQIQTYDIVPGENPFKKGGYHAMLLDLDKKKLGVGTSYPLLLTLGNGETLTCDAKVLSVEDTIKHFSGSSAGMVMPAHQHKKS